MGLAAADQHSEVVPTSTELSGRNWSVHWLSHCVTGLQYSPAVTSKPFEDLGWSIKKVIKLKDLI